MASVKSVGHFERPVRIVVRNNSDQTFTDKFDGEPFEIKPGHYIDMPPEAAKLCFGVGEEDRRRVIQRLGWARTENDMQSALERLNKFSFHGSEEEAEAFGKDKDHCNAPVVADKALPDPKGDGGAVATGAIRKSNLLGKLAEAQANAPA
jgi:hypothetical protein